MAVKIDSAIPSKAESVQAFSNRFGQDHSELQYAAQSCYNGATSRRIAIQEVNEEALHMYIHRQSTRRNWSNSACQICDPKTLATTQERAINVKL